MGIGLGGCRLLHLGNFGPQAFQLLVERRLVGEQYRQLLVPLTKSGFQHLQLLDALLGRRGSLGQRIGVELQPRRWAPLSSIGAGQPVPNVEQFADCDHRVRLLDGPVTVYSLIAQLDDYACLAEYRFAGSGLEGGFMNQGAQVVLIRNA